MILKKLEFVSITDKKKGQLFHEIVGLFYIFFFFEQQFILTIYYIKKAIGFSLHNTS